MKVKEKISIDDFDDKRYQTKRVNPYGKALITHYLHNYNDDISEHYEEDAVKGLEHLVQYKQEEEELNIVAEDAMQQLLFEVENVPFRTREDYDFTFIDLFAGIGGFRLAMQNVGGKCVFTSEWEPSAQKTYRTNFGEVPFGDISKEQVKNYIPEDFDIVKLKLVS